MPAIASAEGPIWWCCREHRRVGAVVAVDLAHDVELLRHDAVREAEAADELVARRDRPGCCASCRRSRCRCRVRRRAVNVETAVERDPEPALLAELLVDDADHLRRERRVAEPHVLVRRRRRQVEARDDADAQVGRPARLEKPRLEVQADVADALTARA